MRKSCSILVQKMYTNSVFITIPKSFFSDYVDNIVTYPHFITKIVNILNTVKKVDLTDNFTFFYTLSTIPITTTIN